MFERFTPEARAVVVGAIEHARRLGHHWVGGEHLLLGVVTSDAPMGDALREQGVTRERIEEILLGGPSTDPLDKDALATLGIDVDAVRAAVEQTFGFGALDREPTPDRGRRRGLLGDRPPLTPQAKQCLADAVHEAQAELSGHIGGEHLALAVVSSHHGAVPGILKAAAVTPAQLRTAILDRYRRAG